MWGIWTIWLLVQNGAVKNPFWNGDLLLGLLLIVALFVVGHILMIRYKRKKQVLKG
jgi:hypothetical protein